MNKIFDLEKISVLYDRGENLMEYFKSGKNDGKNTTENILISYDFQSGKYIDYALKNPDHSKNYTEAIANVMNCLGEVTSIMEVGVGEATTLAHLLPKLKCSVNSVLGFDISWSRLRYGLSYLEKSNITNTELFVGDMFDIPLHDNAVDVVYTSHSIEPNGGREKEALESLYRVAAKYIVLLEPSYHFGSDKAKARMRKHGYVRTLYKTAIALGYNVSEYKLFDYIGNELNPTELIVIKKEKQNSNCQYRCPISNNTLMSNNTEYYSKDGLVVYPVISKIPCLLAEHAIIATKYSDFL